MKKEIRIVKIASCLLKKIFFNKQKNDFYHECEEVLGNSKEKDEIEVEEYLNNYQSTTRWQTV